MLITEVSVNLLPNPYFNQTLKSKFLETIRQKFKIHIHFYTTDIALSEYDFNLNFCRVVIDKFSFKVMLRYGTRTVQEQIR